MTTLCWLGVRRRREALPRRGLLRWCTLVVLAGSLLSCQLPDRYLIYPNEIPSHVESWTQDVDKGPLRLHLVWAKPVGAEPWPTVLGGTLHGREPWGSDWQCTRENDDETESDGGSASLHAVL